MEGEQPYQYLNLAMAQPVSLCSQCYTCTVHLLQTAKQTRGEGNCLQFGPHTLLCSLRAPDQVL